MHTANTNTTTNSSATIIPFPTNDRPARAHEGAPATVLAFPTSKIARERRIAETYSWLAQGKSTELLDYLTPQVLNMIGELRESLAG